MLRAAANPTDLEDDHPDQHFRDKLNELSAVQLKEENTSIIRNRKQSIIPRTARKNLLRELHRSHSGISKTYLTAKELYYWPNMKSDIITNHVAACSACTEDLPAQPRHKLMEDKKPTDAGAPMGEIGVDYFSALGTNWLVAVDCYSGYAWTAKIAKANTYNTLTQLVTWFDKFGWPKKIRSDGGPQFRQVFTNFCKLL